MCKVKRTCKMCTKCASASLATVSEAADPVDAARAAPDLGKRARVQPAEACDEWLVLTHAAAAALVTEATSFGMLVDRLETLNEPMLQHCTECAACAEEALARTTRPRGLPRGGRGAGRGLLATGPAVLTGTKSRKST